MWLEISWTEVFTADRDGDLGLRPAAVGAPLRQGSTGSDQRATAPPPAARAGDGTVRGWWLLIPPKHHTLPHNRSHVTPSSATSEVICNYFLEEAKQTLRRWFCTDPKRVQTTVDNGYVVIRWSARRSPRRARWPRSPAPHFSSGAPPLERWRQTERSSGQDRPRHSMCRGQFCV